jgi:hypothetical protein
MRNGRGPRGDDGPGIAGPVADSQPTATLAAPAAPVVVLENARRAT